MKLKFAILLSVCLSISFISCSHGDESGSSNPEDNLKFLDIVGAKNLYISTGSITNRSARNVNNTKRIFKITEAGYTEEVSYYDEEKKEITISNQPVAIYPINDTYVFVGFGWDDWIDNSYLVRKSDGAVFGMETAGCPENNINDYKNSKIIKMDKNNNIC